jgi:hypothetical protein
MNNTAVAYAAHHDATPESEIAALASVYRLVLNCHTRKEATRPGSPDDEKGSKHDSRQQQYTG